MWYQNVIADLSKDTLYTRKQIYNELKQIKPTLSKDSFNWVINKLVKEGALYREQRGIYVPWNDANCLSKKNIYVPQYSKKSNEIAMAIEDEFPLVDFVCFESVQLNLVSEHPRNTEVKHGISIEQLLVDVVAEKTFRLLYSKNAIHLQGWYLFNAVA